MAENKIAENSAHELELYRAIAKGIPKSIKQIRGIIKTISDNKLTLRLSIMANNYELIHTKLGFYLSVWDKESDPDRAVAKDCMKTIDDLVKLNLDLAEIVRTEVREERYRAWTKAIADYASEGLSFAKKNPELLVAVLVPGGLPGKVLSAGAMAVGKKLLQGKKE
jgi:hypothetical protein